MPKFFVKENQVQNNKITIIGSDVNHIINVLRMKDGDKLNICNADNSQNYLAEIINIQKKEIECKIIETLEAKEESNVDITIYQGLPKADKMELIIQKCVELGVKKIVPVDMKRCVVKIDSKNKQKKLERWNKIAEVAAKQCGRSIIPVVEDIQGINQISNDFNKYNLVLLCYENEKQTLLKNVLKTYSSKGDIKIAVIIGPEGGIDSSEVDYMEKSGATVVSLGSRILRTETVALSISSILMYEFERNEY